MTNFTTFQLSSIADLMFFTSSIDLGMKSLNPDVKRRAMVHMGEHGVRP